jgi:hypothetical protein
MNAGRFVVKARLRSEQLPFIPCSTDDEAMQAAFRLFDEYGRDLVVEIYWNGATLIRGAANVAILRSIHER